MVRYYFFLAYFLFSNIVYFCSIIFEIQNETVCKMEDKSISKEQMK